MARKMAKSSSSSQEQKKDATTTVSTSKVENKNTRRETTKKFNKDDEILCKSVTVGGLYLDGPKSKEFYSWLEYGDEEYVQYQDLTAMVRRTKEPYIYSPLFIIEDEDFIEEHPQLKEFYENQYTVSDLRDILYLSEREMVSAIESLPKGARENMKNIASSAVASGELDSLRKIKVLDEIFGTELNLLSDLIN